MFETEQEAKHYADRMEYRTLRREFNQMTLEELNSDRAKELERRIWGRNANFEDCDYVPGTIIEERKKEKNRKQRDSAIVAESSFYVG